MIATCRSLGNSLVWSILFSSICVARVACGETAPAVPPAPAHVRFWKTELRTVPAVRATVKSIGRHPVTTELGGSGSGYAFNSYVDLPAGHVTFEVFAGSNKKPLRTLQADLVAGTFTTVLLGMSDKAADQLSFELIDDGPAITSTDAAQLRVRFFVPGLKEAKVSMGDALNAAFASEDAYLRLRGLKPAAFSIHTTGAVGSGKSFEWNNEADFRQHRRLTLLVYPDPYGRIRPRLIEDAELVAAPVNEDGQR